MIKALAAVAAACLAVTAWAANPTVELETSSGRITLELYPEKAPTSVENFLSYVRSGHYDGTIFHRVIDRFMIQGGGFDQEMKQKEVGAPIRNEAKNGLKNKAGAIAMARTSNPHSATAQFFINLVDNANLDYPSPDGWGYTVFGAVTEGMDVVRQIGQVRTTTVGYYRDVPAEPIVIESARVVGDATTSN
ncbi:MAG: peptidyl-prolyl cis-trans isomerase [Xanthomonadales bacterium]|nr:peptidyl-prolyl cis-trans isomerase [Xanthomonadales bacterium]MCB1917254.1 peptidyl-prolyl cis-trans isomerase [Rhodocyclaceae bacterium]